MSKRKKYDDQDSDSDDEIFDDSFDSFSSEEQAARLMRGVSTGNLSFLKTLFESSKDKDAFRVKLKSACEESYKDSSNNNDRKNVVAGKVQNLYNAIDQSFDLDEKEMGRISDIMSGFDRDSNTKELRYAMTAYYVALSQDKINEKRYHFHPVLVRSQAQYDAICSVSEDVSDSFEITVIFSGTHWKTLVLKKDESGLEDMPWNSTEEILNNKGDSELCKKRQRDAISCPFFASDDARTVAMQTSVDSKSIRLHGTDIPVRMLRTTQSICDKNNPTLAEIFGTPSGKKSETVSQSIDRNMDGDWNMAIHNKKNQMQLRTFVFLMNLAKDGKLGELDEIVKPFTYEGFEKLISPTQKIEINGDESLNKLAAFMTKYRVNREQFKAETDESGNKIYKVSPMLFEKLMVFDNGEIIKEPERKSPSAAVNPDSVGIISSMAQTHQSIN